MLRVCSPAELMEDDEKKKIDASKLIKEDVEVQDAKMERKRRLK